MEELTMEVAEKRRITWKDFPLEVHIRGHVGVPQGCVMKYKLIHDNIYRVNVIRLDGTFAKSVRLKIISTPDGYIFEEQ